MGTISRRGFLAGAGAALCASQEEAGAAALADRVLVVRNRTSPTSMAVAEYYMKRRGVKNLATVACIDSALKADNESIKWSDFLKQIAEPVLNTLKGKPGVDFIVLTKGIPIRIVEAQGRGMNGSRPSLDGTLASMGYDRDPRVSRITYGAQGERGTALANRFFNSEERFSHARFNGYLVTRLDGYTLADAKALVDRSLAAEKSRPKGKVLLDISPGYGIANHLEQPRPIFQRLPGKTTWTPSAVEYPDFNGDMVKAAATLQAVHIPVELDRTEKMIGERKNLMGYVSWGSNDKKWDEKAYRSITFAPGGLAETAVSSSGRTLLKTTGGQSLIADMIAQGATGAKGYTDEPFLAAMASPTILFERYARGWTLAESFYAASRFVGWEDLVLGDPLCRPYAAPRAGAGGL